MLRLRVYFTVLAALAARPAGAATATIDSTKTYQTIEGLGGATAFYEGWIPAHPYQQEIYTNAFAGLNLSMLRLGDWYGYQTPLAGFDSAATTIVSNANRVLGHPVPVFMSSWSPPAFLKSNGQTGNGGTLLYTNGGFAYTNFAQYWYDSINAYQSNGVSLTWLSIQNEPDWAASYDSCVFYPTEETVNGTNYASYSKALDATYQLLTNLPSPPKMLAPECVGIGYNDVAKFRGDDELQQFLWRHAPSLRRQHRWLARRIHCQYECIDECLSQQAAFHDRIWLSGHDQHGVLDSRLPHRRAGRGL